MKNCQEEKESHVLYRLLGNLLLYRLQNPGIARNLTGSLFSQCIDLFNKRCRSSKVKDPLLFCVFFLRLHNGALTTPICRSVSFRTVRGGTLYKRRVYVHPELFSVAVPAEISPPSTEVV
jgi:hypothetical protein